MAQFTERAQWSARRSSVSVRIRSPLARHNSPRCWAELHMQASATHQRTYGWLLLLILTVALNLTSAFLFPTLATDAFTPQIFIVSVLPVIWGFFVLFV